MRKYLANLHTKSDAHKKRFAFAVSGGASLSILAIWAAVNFGPYGKILSSNTQPMTKTEVEEVSPLESLRANVSSGFSGILESVGVLKKSLNEIKTESPNTSSNSSIMIKTAPNNTYTNLQTGQIEIYGGQQ